MDSDYGRKVLAPAIALVLQITIGLCNNIIIISAIFYDSIRQKNLSNSNKIILCLNVWDVSYALLICVALADQFVCLGASSTYVFSSMLIILLLYNISSCAWMTAGLASFYFIQISQVRFFMWVKTHISSIVPWTLLVLQVMSFINGFSSSFLLIFPRVTSRNITHSPPCATDVLAENSPALVNAAIAATSIPFIIVFISTVCTLWTLKRHSQKMVRNMETVDNGHLTSYERVVRRMTYSFSFYVIYYTFMLIFYFSIISQIESGFMVTLLLLSSFPLLQFILLTLSNPRFKDAWKEMLHSLAMWKE
ncbi:taste receptor type 2 member 119-like [Dendropsophus ebraccatus]|uniref:taste receptor type 2 member 119-like n=1 Tax=Dendropsophus ebraccatus TaxID=150705 RepID=UPI0038311FA9